jgi:UDP-N-acetylglucosamine acyltransferase
MSGKNHHAVIHPDAKIGLGTTVGPFCVIEGDVVIGTDCEIGPHVTIMDGARIGNNVKIFPGAVISAEPQDLKYRGEYTLAYIGDHTTIREYVTINKGTAALGKTVVGSHCLLMAYVHIAHDCHIGDHCILANNATLAGHIHIDDYAIVGGLVAIHQFVRIGKHAMIGGGSLVRKDVPPYVTASREPVSYAGVNRIGLQRRGFVDAQINMIEQMYRLLYVRGHAVSKALEIIDLEIPDGPEKLELQQFVQSATRGLIRGYHGVRKDED